MIWTSGQDTANAVWVSGAVEALDDLEVSTPGEDRLRTGLARTGNMRLPTHETSGSRPDANVEVTRTPFLRGGRETTGYEPLASRSPAPRSCRHTVMLRV